MTPELNQKWSTGAAWSQSLAVSARSGHQALLLQHRRQRLGGLFGNGNGAGALSLFTLGTSACLIQCPWQAVLQIGTWDLKKGSASTGLT